MTGEGNNNGKVNGGKFVDEAGLITLATYAYGLWVTFGLGNKGEKLGLKTWLFYGW